MPLCGSLIAHAQSSSKSLLINHGGTSCGSDAPQQHFFAGTLTPNPTLIASCDLGIPYYSVLASYNPADHKIYFAYMPGNSTSIYAADFNFGGSMSCPSLTAPTYQYNYALNQLCFDNNGNNYIFFNFDQTAGTAHLAQANITTGEQIPGTEKIVRFPANNIPNSVLFGDMVILPNGRMFATFGNGPSKLFELTNFSSGTGDATAVFLTDVPRQCFSIGFVDGNLTVAGSDGGGCYYYIWDINSASLSTAFPFPLSKNSSDMSNLTLAVGCTKELMGSTNINYNTAILFYQVTIKNKGNIFLNNIQATDNLANVFGANNVSNVSVTFVSNPAGLQLNPSYDGVNNINLLAPGQMLNNYPSGIDSIVLNVRATVTHLSPSTVYNNSAVVTGNIGAGSNYLAVSDSSNNGDHSRMDIDGNGVSDDAGENTPTPYVFGYVLPLSTLELRGSRNGNQVALTWQGLTDRTVDSYEVQRSLDGRVFQTIGTIRTTQSSYHFNDMDLPQDQSSWYYRIRVSEASGRSVFSNTLLMTSVEETSIRASPNPFTNFFNLTIPSATKSNASIIIRDISGRVLVSRNIQLEKGDNYLAIAEAERFQRGAYIAEITTPNGSRYVKLVKQ
jgi:hypothetical protein